MPKYNYGRDLESIGNILMDRLLWQRHRDRNADGWEFVFLLRLISQRGLMSVGENVDETDVDYRRDLFMDNVK